MCKSHQGLDCNSRPRAEHFSAESVCSNQVDLFCMLKLLLFCILFILCWPLALLALVLYPLVWLVLLPFRIFGIAVHGVLALVTTIIFLPVRVIRSIA